MPKTQVLDSIPSFIVCLEGKMKIILEKFCTFSVGPISVILYFNSKKFLLFSFSKPNTSLKTSFQTTDDYVVN